MKPIFLLSSALFSAFVVVACTAADPALVADRSPGGRCLLEGSACVHTEDCCTQSCENGTCVSRDP